MAKNLVVKDNALINASYNLDLVEQRLILLAIIEARATGKGISPNNSLTITASSYMNNYHTNRNTAYQALKDACHSLFERQFSYIETNAKGNQEVVRSRWVSEVRYIKNEASVKLIFSPTVSPLITLLEKNFTSYELEQVAELNSKYAVRLYEIIIAWRTTGTTPMIEIGNLRERLGVLNDEYIVTADFKRWVLDKSIEQINKNTYITISYEQHKEGRKIVGFTFTIQQKNKIKSQRVKKEMKQDKENQIIDLFDGLNDLESQAVQARVNEYIAQLENKGEIVSDFYRENLTKKAVTERWGLDVLAKKQAKTKATQERKAKKQAEQQAEKDKKAKSRQELEQRKALVMTKFENLAPEQQDHTLHEIAKRIGKGAFEPIFKTAMKEGTAHTDERFTSYFYEYFGFDL